ncbi:SbcC/MukB-like Walker B domain-containing protein [Enterococcus mundtii]|nr:SbcC/MukB-like Walker B domain-containing protein [Enterococcus mundtii]MDB7087851.1 SbcC/MukB-like Walker B domain-containing protein [Enterococcus mundtii]
MNQILQNTKDENRLRLSIRWIAKIAESEQEMNTKDLVRILRQPSAMLTSEDLERMIRHFREKINYAKILRDKDEEEAGQSLHEVMKDVLDYRHWFKFLLEYQKDNEPKRELTNPRFYKLSGGEKAVAMYLPLFTAMYARFEDAKAEAPRIVCLDEAFAGVDELNIADLFGTLEDLGFDYLLNSQALWGDYDTVSSLNVYQLLRKANSTTVGMVRSHWNGKRQEMLGD